MRQMGQVAMHYSGRSYDGPTPGAAVPGYTGFVPGRYANNIIGSTHAKGARAARNIHDIHEMPSRNVAFKPSKAKKKNN